MKICGIICELNPLHNGHKYLFEQARKKTFADKIVALMSGNFVQRGEPAFIDERVRAEIAIKCGADAVIELPTVYAVASSEVFARGAIKILKSIGANCIALGVENNLPELLHKIARAQMTNEFDKMIKESNLPYPKSVTLATEKLLKNENYDSTFISSVLHKPNNILAIEYIKASMRQRYNCNFEFFERIDCEHAQDIRNDFDSKAKKNMPEISFDLTKENYIDYVNQYSAIMLHEARTASALEISSTPDCAEGYENVIKKQASLCGTFEDMLKSLSTARFTQNRIKRILLQTALRITKDMQNFDYTNARLLGIKETAKDLLKELPNSIISNIDFEKYISNKSAICYDLEKRATLLYATIQKRPSKFYEKLLTV